VTATDIQTEDIQTYHSTYWNNKPLERRGPECPNKRWTGQLHREGTGRGRNLWTCTVHDDNKRWRQINVQRPNYSSVLHNITIHVTYVSANWLHGAESY